MPAIQADIAYEMRQELLHLKDWADHKTAESPSLPKDEELRWQKLSRYQAYSTPKPNAAPMEGIHDEIKMGLSAHARQDSQASENVPRPKNKLRIRSFRPL